MKRLQPDRVTIIIAHRLGSLMHADRILFLEDGEIVERGTHDELLALGGRYRALHDLQLRPGRAADGSGCRHDARAESRREGATRRAGGRPPRRGRLAPRIEEEIFGRAFDGHIVSRIWRFVQPYQARMLIAVAAVLIFTATQLAIPLIIRHAIDHGMVPGGRPLGAHLGDCRLRGGDPRQLSPPATCRRPWSARSPRTCSSTCAGRCSRHLQRVSLSFMDKTEIGRLMSRLQGDVNSMQEFLETSVLSVGDIALLFGIVGVMLSLDWRLGAPHALGDAGPLRRAPVLAAARARSPSWPRTRRTRSTNGALAEGINGVRAVQSMDRQRVNFMLYDDKACANLEGAPDRRALRPDHGADRRHADRHRHGGGGRRRRRAACSARRSTSA